VGTSGSCAVRGELAALLGEIARGEHKSTNWDMLSFSIFDLYYNGSMLFAAFDRELWDQV
jgi:hypothetical protein